MKRKVGDMWDVYTGDPEVLFLFAGNQVLTNDGALVMGVGSAAQAKEKFPGIEHALGTKITNMLYPEGLYGVVTHGNVGSFQTKKHWRDRSQEHIIRFSVNVLMATVHKYREINMVYPGIGHGGLGLDHVEPMIMALPNHVYVWTMT